MATIFVTIVIISLLLSLAKDLCVWPASCLALFWAIVCHFNMEEVLVVFCCYYKFASGYENHIIQASGWKIIMSVMSVVEQLSWWNTETASRNYPTLVNFKLLYSLNRTPCVSCVNARTLLWLHPRRFGICYYCLWPRGIFAQRRDFRSVAHLLKTSQDAWPYWIFVFC